MNTAFRAFFLFGALSACAAATAQQAADTSSNVSDQESISPREDPANWRKVDPENLLLLLINGQDVLVELRPDFSPVHVAQIRTITRNGHYDGLPFHRVIDDFMAQGGEVSAVYSLPQPYPSLAPEFTFRRNPGASPLVTVNAGNGSGHNGYLDGFMIGSKPDAIAPLMADGSVDSWIMHCPGVASMARSDSPGSADTQFFLMRQAQTQLDQSYTAWGRVLAGLEAVRGIKKGPSSTDGRLPPDSADRLMRATIVADMPVEDRPVVYVQRTEGPAFRQALASRPETGQGDPCYLPPVPVIVESNEIG